MNNLEKETKITNINNEFKVLFDKGEYGEIIKRGNYKKMDDQIISSDFWGDLACYKGAESIIDGIDGCDSDCECCCCVGGCAVAGILGISYVCTGGFGTGCNCLSDAACELWEICCCCYW